MPPLDSPARGQGLLPEAAAALQADLARAVRGEVQFDTGTRAVYAHDASNYRQVPIGVVLPRSVDDVIAAMRVCREHDVPVLARGGGTAQNGQTVNVAVVIDCSRHLNRVLEVDASARRARVEPGVVCDALRDAAEVHGLTFGPDPATHSRCTLGGMIGNNSCGAHSVMAGKTVENIESLEVLTYDGVRMKVGPTDDATYARIQAEGGRPAQIHAGLRALAERYAPLIRSRYPRIRRRVSGYNLDQLLPENGFNVARALVGSEGTCAMTLQAVTRLVHSPRHRVLLVLGFADIYRAGDAVPWILPFGPIATEGLDERIIGGLRERGLRAADIAKLPAGGAWIMAEFGGDTPAQAIEQARALAGHASAQAQAPSHWLVTDPREAEAIWSIRETAASATALALVGQPDPQVGWEDAAVDPLRLGDYLREFQALVDRHGYQTSLYGHFGDGCIHARITFDLRTHEGIARWRGFTEAAAHLVVRYGGSLSGEHGDGQAKAEFLPVMYGPELMQAFREFKAIWDPRGRMNPGKLIDAWRIDENLRHGPDYRPIEFATRMRFSSPEGDGLVRAVEHCVGMGKCRAQSGGVMCPSYRVTGEERHSTRGRARLLGEMLRGELITDGWKSSAVKEALDLCLSCKGCRSDCPTHTDMAAFKAEFLHHYHQHHPRPRQAWSMGRVQRWLALGARAPRLVNAMLRVPPFAALARWLGGIASQRALPVLAAQGFRAGFLAGGSIEREGGLAVARRVPGEAPRGRVLLWVDTFSEHLRPEVARAAVRVLEHAGFEVAAPPAGLCCGRPLYDFGLLDEAAAQLTAVLDALADPIAAGVPVVGLEPACVSVFRDELRKLFPDDPRAQRLAAQVVTLPELLVREGVDLPRLEARVLVQAHCHQRALGGTRADEQVLDAMGVRHEWVDAGCCGMAGSFGFHRDHYPLSVKAARVSLLPALEARAPGTRVIASGYSCREQAEQLGGCPTEHLAELIAEAFDRDGARSPSAAGGRGEPSSGQPVRASSETARESRPGASA